jgi:hypothetical protein
MKRLLFPVLLIAILLPMAARAAPRLEYITIGPMLHFNFGGNAYQSFSWGLEAAYWNYPRGPEDGFLKNSPDTPGWGAALGFEVDRNAFRFHLEPQVGWVLAGLSLGSVLEAPRGGGPTLLGLQGSAWMNAILGFDLRYRRIGGKNFQALGQYVKIGALVSGRAEPTD